MWSLILQAIGANKWIAYGLVAVTLVASVGTVIYRIRAGGVASEKARAANENLLRMRKEALERARIEALTTAAARKQLRKRWSAN